MMTALFDRLVQSSLEGGLLIAAVWLVCRLAPALPASLRVVFWWLATAKLLVGLAGLDPIALPVLPATATAGRTEVRPYVLAAAPDARTGRTEVRPYVPPRTADVTQGVRRAELQFGQQSRTDWRWWSSCAWLAMVGGLMIVAVRQRHRTRRLIASAGPAEPRLLDLVDALSEQVGLTGTPDTRRADRVESPMVAGLLAPVVLLPRTRFDALPDVQQQMAICHELVHLRRGDLWLGCVPALAERLFFFHPLAHLAAREYLLAREAACDADVLRAMNAAPQEYGRLLLALGVSPLRAGFAASSTSRSFSSLKRRISMLNQSPASAGAKRAGWLVAAVTACAIVPIQLVARTAPSPLRTETPASSASPARSVTAAVTATTPSTGAKAETRKHLEFALILDDHHTIMNGSINDRRIEELRKAGGRVLWFKYQGKEYLTSDPAALEEAQAIYEPVSVIGAQQGEIGARQGAIGAQQGNVGAKQGAIGARQGEIGAKQGAIGAQQGAIGAKQSRNLSPEEQKQLDAEMSKLDQEMKKLDEQMKALDEEMEQAGKPMAELDAKMKELDVQMEALDKQMDAASAKADAQMDALLERLVKAGTAKTVK